METQNTVKEDLNEIEDDAIEKENDEEDDEVEIEEEDFFLKLFDEAFNLRRREGIASDEDIRESIQNQVDFFRENRSPAGLCARNRFSHAADYLGYFYYFSPISAAVTRFKALGAIGNCEELLLCIRRPSVKVVSVGGGTGSDLVGLCSALYETSAIEDMELVLIEENENWKPYLQATERLLRNGDIDFGNASKFIQSKDIKTSFICADMRKEFSPECLQALEEANLVWMKGFLSTLRNNNERRCVTDEIIASMTAGALLVVMESLAYDQFEVFVNERKLERLFNTNGDYRLCLNSQAKYRIISSAKVEMIIFKKI